MCHLLLSSSVKTERMGLQRMLWNDALHGLYPQPKTCSCNWGEYDFTMEGQPRRGTRIFTMICSLDATSVCPFCTAKDVQHVEEDIRRSCGNDGGHEWTTRRIPDQAMHAFAGAYRTGKHGLSQNMKKAEELLQRSYA